MDKVAMMGQFLGVMLACTGGVWATTEALGKGIGPKVPNVWLALVLGPAVGAAAHAAKFLPVPEATGTAGGYVFACTMGLVCTFGAKAVNDRINPLNKSGPVRRMAAKGSRLP